jgi:hypothetical protein
MITTSEREKMPASNSTRRKTDSPIFEDMASSGNPIVDAPKRTRRAVEYETKIAKLFSSIMRATAGSEKTLPDAAALLMHGPIIASKTGDLADQDDRVRRMVDMISSGTENPYLALAAAALPLAVQIVRNHETETPVRVGIRIPFTRGKRSINFPFRLRLKNPVLRSATYSANDITTMVFNNPAIRDMLMAQRVEVAYPGYALPQDFSQYESED